LADDPVDHADMGFAMERPAIVAVKQGDVEAWDVCSPTSFKTLRKGLIVRGALGNAAEPAGPGLDASAFMMVWRGMSVDFALFR
jgi:hypothetical protein